MLLNNQGQVVKLTKNQEQACREATTLQQHLDKNNTIISTKARAILNKRINILQNLREKLWPSGDKPDSFFQLGARARLV